MNDYLSIRQKLGRLIKQKREKLRISQYRLCKDLILHRAQYSKIERGLNYPNSFNLFQLMKALKITPEELEVLINNE